jgi:hypothetical protein
MKSRITAPRAVPALLAALALASLATSAALFAQEAAESEPPITDHAQSEEIFQNQPPLTDADVLVAIEILAASATGSGPDVTLPIGERAGMDPRRVMYCTTRVMAGYLMSLPEATPEEIAERFGSPLVIPTPAEIEVIKPHLQAMGLIMQPDDEKK